MINRGSEPVRASTCIVSVSTHEVVYDCVYLVQRIQALAFEVTRRLVCFIMSFLTLASVNRVVIDAARIFMRVMFIQQLACDITVIG